VWVAVTDGERVAVTVDEAEGDALAVGTREGVAEGECVGVTDGEAVAVAGVDDEPSPAQPARPLPPRTRTEATTRLATCRLAARGGR